MRILLVEDDEIIGKAVSSSLVEQRYAVEWIKEGKAAEVALRTNEYAAAIIDINLPDLNGLDILKSARQHDVRTPVLLLSARGSAEEITQGLDLGADDYIAKPFSLSVLFARLRAVVRRSHAKLTSTVDYAGIKLDPNSFSVYIEGERISISRREYTLLNKLLENTGEVVSREVLSQCIYGAETEVESNAVEVHVHNLRKKLRGNIIKTIRGVGYIVDAPRGYVSTAL